MAMAMAGTPCCCCRPASLLSLSPSASSLLTPVCDARTTVSSAAFPFETNTDSRKLDLRSGSRISRESFSSLLAAAAAASPPPPLLHLLPAPAKKNPSRRASSGSRCWRPEAAAAAAGVFPESKQKQEQEQEQEQKQQQQQQQPQQAWRKKTARETNVMIVGATGYIGKYVVKEMVKRGYNVIAVAREKSGIGGKASTEQTVAELAGATVCFADATDMDSLTTAIGGLLRGGTAIDVVISCLASRTGGKKDSWKIDYEATKNSLDAGVAAGASHFVLLSAICVQKPLLEFQKAKLRFESELANHGHGLTYSIVRPTAFFKSLGGQVQSVKGGGPFVMFGDGALCACKPISEADLASFIADCVADADKSNKILPIGGPGKALTPREQGEMLFRLLGKEPRFLQVPIGIMDFVIGVLDSLAKVFPNLEDPAEFGKIGKYYATESMLVLDPVTSCYDADATPSYGHDTLEAFFDHVVQEGMAGQELGDQAIF